MKLIDLLNVISYVYEVHIILNDSKVATVNFTDEIEPIITKEIEPYLDYEVEILEVGYYFIELEVWVNSQDHITITIQDK